MPLSERINTVHKKKNLGRKIYFIFLTIYVVLLSAAACYGLKIVWDYAEEYEAARPDYVISAYVDELRQNRWVDSMEDTVKAMSHEMQTNSECADVVKEMLANEITYSRTASDSAGTASYSLFCDGRKFGVITLVEDEDYADKVKYGMLPWKISEESFDFTGLYSHVEITVPSTFTVELNGNELGEEYIVEENIKMDVLEDYYESCPTLPTKVTYRFENVIGTLNPVVYDENGNEFVIDESRDDSQYIKACDDATMARLNDFAYEFSVRYFEFISGITDPGYGYARLSTVMKSGSDLDDRMKRALDGLSWAHTASLRIDSIELNGGSDLGDGYYLADVTTKTTTLQPGQGEVNGTHNLKIVIQDSANELRALMLELY